MRLAVHPDAASFLRDAQIDFERHEAEHCLILGAALAAQQEPLAYDRIYSVTVRTRLGRLVVGAFMTPPHAVILTETDSIDARSLIAVDLAASKRAVSGVFARPETAAMFSDLWRSQTGQNAHLAFHMALYSAESVERTSPPPGRLRRATDEDRGIVAEWIAAFQREIFNENDPQKADKTARRRIAANELYVWDDNGLRSMAGSVRPTQRGISVNAVYTPPALRGQGYATACVGVLTERLLANGWSFCTLFADLANPTSNAIYQKIGYRPIAEFAQYRFEVPSSVPTITPAPSRLSP